MVEKKSGARLVYVQPSTLHLTYTTAVDACTRFNSVHGASHRAGWTIATMSQYSQSSTASFEEYTTGLRNGLREAARMGLSQLEEMINEVGYGWLDGYMESIMESSSSK